MPRFLACSAVRSRRPCIAASRASSWSAAARVSASLVAPAAGFSVSSASVPVSLFARPARRRRRQPRPLPRRSCGQTPRRRQARVVRLLRDLDPALRVILLVDSNSSAGSGPSSARASLRRPRSAGSVSGSSGDLRLEGVELLGQPGLGRCIAQMWGQTPRFGSSSSSGSPLHCWRPAQVAGRRLVGALPLKPASSGASPRDRPRRPRAGSLRRTHRGSSRALSSPSIAGRALTKSTIALR